MEHTRMESGPAKCLLLVVAACSLALPATDPVSLVTDFSGGTAPFDPIGAQYVTSQFYSAPGCMGVAAQAVLAKSEGWPYQVSAAFYAGQNYPTFPMRVKFMVKAGNYIGGMQQFSIDIVARQHPGDPTWLGAYIGRRLIVKTATTADWFVGIDTVITDFGATVDQNGQTFRQLYSGPVILYLAVVPGDRKVYVDNVCIAEASATGNSPARLSVRPSVPEPDGVLRIYAPNGRALGNAERPSAMNYMVEVMGGEAHGRTMGR